jgi:hypothetical protein
VSEEAAIAVLQLLVGCCLLVYLHAIHCGSKLSRVGLAKCSSFSYLLTRVTCSCYLLCYFLVCSLSADEALERVQRAFDTRKDNERRSPETDEQHAMVRKFVASHKSRQAGSLHPGHE